jgi:hypothetical protein
MTAIYRVFVKKDAHQADVGRMVLNGDGTGFIVLKELLPGMILHVEPRPNSGARKTTKTRKAPDQ